MFWKIKKDKIYEQLLRQWELTAAEVKIVQKDIEIINIKLRKKVYRETEDQQEIQGLPIDDGFNELRRLKKL